MNNFIKVAKQGSTLAMRRNAIKSEKGSLWFSEQTVKSLIADGEWTVA